MKAEWPERTNYWVAAEIGPGVFLREASKEYGANFYRMDGFPDEAENANPLFTLAKEFLRANHPEFVTEG